MEAFTDYIQRFAEGIACVVKQITQACYRAMATLRIFFRRIGLLPYIRPRTRSLKRARIYQRRALI